jgi:hypothetical protein
MHCLLVCRHLNALLHECACAPQDPPYFTVLPGWEYRQEAGRELLIPCAAAGDPFPVITWRKVLGLWSSWAVREVGQTWWPVLPGPAMNRPGVEWGDDCLEQWMLPGGSVASCGLRAQGWPFTVLTVFGLLSSWCLLS